MPLTCRYEPSSTGALLAGSPLIPAPHFEGPSASQGAVQMLTGGKRLESLAQLSGWVLFEVRLRLRRAQKDCAKRPFPEYAVQLDVRVEEYQ